MKDGKRVSFERKVILHYELEKLGWWLFRIPEELLDEVSAWIDDLSVDDEDASWDIHYYLYDSASKPKRLSRIDLVAIRRYEDAVLFKLSWEECKPLEPF